MRSIAVQLACSSRAGQAVEYKQIVQLGPNGMPRRKAYYLAGLFKLVCFVLSFPSSQLSEEARVLATAKHPQWGVSCFVL